jgi:hypothetical protein
MELTSAYKPPARQFEAATATADAHEALPEVGRQLEDGSGVLADGTKCVGSPGVGGDDGHAGLECKCW